MDKTPNYEKFLNDWNGEFPLHPLTIQDLKKPHAVIGALLQLFERLGIDRDAVVMPPPEDERDEHTIYYWDLLPVINVTRICNYLISLIHLDNMTLSITVLLDPVVSKSHCLLLLLCNMMIFNEDRMKSIAPDVEELLTKRDQVQILEDKKNELLDKLNQQAQEKAKRAGRIEKILHDIQKTEEELTQEKEAHNIEKQELEALIEEERQAELLHEQKKVQRDALLAEVARKRALRVYDADDIKAQVEQAAQNVQEAEEKLSLLQATLMQKETSLKNLQTIKPNLDMANNLLHEIMKISESLKDYEKSELQTDNGEELMAAEKELKELEAQLLDAETTRAHDLKKRQEAQARRNDERIMLESAQREAVEKMRKYSEYSKKAVQRIEEIKESTAKYVEEKSKAMEELEKVKRDFIEQVNAFEKALLMKAKEVEEKIENKLNSR